jgi:queuine tRNA-ribosyltransferase
VIHADKYKTGFAFLQAKQKVCQITDSGYNPLNFVISCSDIGGMTNFNFELTRKDHHARAGIFHTPHGELLTPVFAPVGTQATVKAVTPAQLKEIGVSLVLANTYHLYLRPGADLVAEMGGLHHFMQWDAPILTDSGGFQVFSLAGMRKIDEDGVTFKSHIDGSIHRLTPQKAVQIQEQLGADIIMALDECAPPYDRAYNEQALRRTHLWAEGCLSAQTRRDQALFGIVQGGIFPDLREQSARFISSLGFPGHAIGGLSVGETKEEMHRTLELVNDILPEDKPRYLMGVGSPEDLINGIRRGVDIFDCVLPTRLARHQAAMTRHGRINLMNAVHARDPRPIDENCSCYTCTHFSRAYLRHLIVAKEMLAATLISIHNIATLVFLVQDARKAILEGTFEQFAEEFLTQYALTEKSQV